MSFEVLGLDKLMARVVNLKDEILDKASEEGARATAVAIRDTAKSLCPVGTPESTGIPGYRGGSLKKSIRLQVKAKPAGHVHSIGVSAGGYVQNPNTNKIVNYAVYNERGTSKMAPRPFMKPAFEQHKKKFALNIRKAIK